MSIFTHDFLMKHYEDLITSLIFILSSSIFIEILYRAIGIKRIFASILLIFAISALTNTLVPLLWVSIFIFSSYFIGELIFSKMHILNYPSKFVYSVALGMGIYGFFINLIAGLSINYYALYIFLIASPIIMNWKNICKKVLATKEFYYFRINSTIHDLAIGTLIIYLFAVSLMPEIGQDALASHLFIPAQINFNHIWNFDLGNFWFSTMPALVDFIYTFLYMLAGEAGCRLINFFSICLISILFIDFCKYFGGKLPSVRWALLLYLSSSITLLEVSSLFIDSIWTLYILLALFSFIRYLFQKNKIDLYLFAIFLGFALSSKALTLLIIPSFFMLYIFYHKFNIKKLFVKEIFIAVCLILIFGSVSYLRSFILTGNPIYPFHFINPIHLADHFFNLKNFSSNFNSVMPSLIIDSNPLYKKPINNSLLWDLTFHTSRFLESKDGAAGLYWIIIFPLTVVSILFSKNKKVLILMIFAITSFFLITYQIVYLRYLLPLIIIFFLCTAIQIQFLQQLRNKFFINIFLVLMLVVFISNLFVIKLGGYYSALSIKPLIGKEEKLKYLDSKLPIRNAAGLVNRINTSNSPVLLFSPPMNADFKAIPLDVASYNTRVTSQIRVVSNVKEMKNFLKSEGVEFVVIDLSWQSDSFDSNHIKGILLDSTDVITSFGPILVSRVKK